MIINYSEKIVILDADFLIALYIDTDSNHERALFLYDKIENCRVLNLTIYEVATVLSRLFEHKIAKLILKNILADLHQITLNFDPNWEDDIFKIYNLQTKKNISFFDCSLIFLAQNFDYKIASFDQFYPKELLLN